MPTVRELSDPYGNLLLNPQPAGLGICRVCTTFIPEQYSVCPACNAVPSVADAVLPISYEVEGEQLHRALRGYKTLSGRPRRQFEVELAAVLWRFLAIEDHERCLAAAAGVESFRVVTTVPSGSAQRDEAHPLRRLVGVLVQPTRDRYERLLVRSDVAVEDHTFDSGKFQARRELAGEPTLLIDDTWTRGASVQSAAAALKEAGAGVVGVVVIGRYVRPDFQDHRERVDAIRAPFDWSLCRYDQA